MKQNINFNFTHNNILLESYDINSEIHRLNVIKEESDDFFTFKIQNKEESSLFINSISFIANFVEVYKNYFYRIIMMICSVFVFFVIIQINVYFKCQPLIYLFKCCGKCCFKRGYQSDDEQRIEAISMYQLNQNEETS